MGRIGAGEGLEGLERGRRGEGEGQERGRIGTGEE